MIQKAIKVSLNSTEASEEYTVEATIEGNIIIYIEPDETSVTLDKNKNILKRENKRISMEFKFDLENTTNNSILIKDLNQTLDIIIKTVNIINKSNEFVAEYEIIGNDKFAYKIEMSD